MECLLSLFTIFTIIIIITILFISYQCYYYSYLYYVWFYMHLELLILDCPWSTLSSIFSFSFSALRCRCSEFHVLPRDKPRSWQLQGARWTQKALSVSTMRQEVQSEVNHYSSRALLLWPGAPISMSLLPYQSILFLKYLSPRQISARRPHAIFRQAVRPHRTLIIKFSWPISRIREDVQGNKCWPYVLRNLTKF